MAGRDRAAARLWRAGGIANNPWKKITEGRNRFRCPAKLTASLKTGCASLIFPADRVKNQIEES